MGLPFLLRPRCLLSSTAIALLLSKHSSMTVACDALPQQKHRVAIVGSGISGAAVAHFLREGLGDAVELVVIEAGSSIGDRILSWNKNGTILEAGAAALHSSVNFPRPHSILTIFSPQALGWVNVGTSKPYIRPT